MRRTTTTVLIAAFAAALLVSASVVPAAAYIKQPLSKVSISAPSVVRCDTSATITATVRDARTGKPVWQQRVNWSIVQRQSGRDRLSRSVSISRRTGSTFTRLSFGPKAGPRKVKASIGRSQATATIRCAGGLPKTAPLPPDGFEPQPASALIAPPDAGTAEVRAVQLPATGLRIERLGIDLPLVEGDGSRVPDGAAAHYPGTAWPGDGSNLYVYAHARPGHFLELWQAETGDLVEVDLTGGRVATYRVSEIRPLVPWDAFEMLEPTDREILTLQTCLTYEETAPRYVVIAERILTG